MEYILLVVGLLECYALYQLVNLSRDLKDLAKQHLDRAKVVETTALTIASHSGQILKATEIIRKSGELR